ncbi:MAG: hypothetical protein ACREC5_02245 [Thermoplasmata archaeon]
MTPTESPVPTKKPTVSLTPGSRVRVYSAGAREEPFVSVGLFRGLVSVGGENSMALELDGKGTKAPAPGKAVGAAPEDGIRLVPLNAVMAIDILRAAKPEEEKRVEPTGAQGYFR